MKLHGRYTYDIDNYRRTTTPKPVATSTVVSRLAGRLNSSLSMVVLRRLPMQRSQRRFVQHLLRLVQQRLIRDADEIASEPKALTPRWMLPLPSQAARPCRRCWRRLLALRAPRWIFFLARYLCAGASCRSPPPPPHLDTTLQ